MGPRFTRSFTDPHTQATYSISAEYSVETHDIVWKATVIGRTGPVTMSDSIELDGASQADPESAVTADIVRHIRDLPR